MENDTQLKSVLMRKLSEGDSANIKKAITHFDEKTASKAILRALEAFFDLDAKHDELQKKYNRVVDQLSVNEKYIDVFQTSLSYLQKYKKSDVHDSKNDHPSFI